MNNDLISREWLKDAFDNLCCHNCKICRNFRNEDSFYKCNLIENAPTVAVSCKNCDGYEAGYSAGLTDAERPQGEWIEFGVNNQGTYYKCSKCGFVVRDFPETINTTYPFCTCGAKMRKGEKE